MSSEPGPTDGGQGEQREIQSQVNEAIAKLSGPGEPLIALGAALLLFVDIVGDIFMRDYSVPYAAWVPAVLILLAVGAHRYRGASLPVTYGTLLAVLALIGGIVVLREMVTDLRYDYLDRGGARVLFALVAYAGGVVLLVGTWQVWSSMSKDSS